MDLVTPAFRLAAAVAQRVPGTVVDAFAPRVAELAALRPSDRRRMVERHQRRVDPSLSDAELARRVRGVYRSYGRYYGESFRLPAVSPDALDAGMTHEGYHHIDESIAAGKGPILVLPHLGSWEWSAFWLTRVKGHRLTAVVERLEPPALYDWFAGFRQEIGIDVVPLGADAGKTVMGAIRDRHIVTLLCDRDITGGGVEVTFFGEKTTLPSGPAVLAMRTGAPLLPTGVYDRGDTRHGVVRPPIPIERTASFRADVVRVTQAIADELEALIREAPDQWHLMQPNWPSDHEALELGPGGAGTDDDR
ncbi:MAG TPA: phosphatidylinositol mannoside acyltransferase [Acidimicrobiales bacterium]|nr:phosphatidylinositol mannoside acyltransferase [Acidimicrobiales bacterium]